MSILDKLEMKEILLKAKWTHITNEISFKTLIAFKSNDTEQIYFKWNLNNF